MTQLDILSFSGWAQNHQSLNPLFPQPSTKYNLTNYDYSAFPNFKSFLSSFKNNFNPESQPDIILGWSLGGQIASRLCADILRPKLLILISTPFQFVKSNQIAAAMPQKSFLTFLNNFKQSSAQTLEKFCLLMMLNNKRAKELAKNLIIKEDNYNNLLSWLEELGDYSCYDLNFSNFPKTIIFHGQNDVVVHHLQAKIFASKITNSRLEILPDCGHCPHISNQDQLQHIINKEISHINER